jgi:hypothetical protein
MTLSGFVGFHDFSRLMKPSHRNPLLVDKGRLLQASREIVPPVLQESLPYDSPNQQPGSIRVEEQPAKETKRSVRDNDKLGIVKFQTHKNNNDDELPPQNGRFLQVCAPQRR